jgi:hypothetical protein
MLIFNFDKSRLNIWVYKSCLPARKFEEYMADNNPPAVRINKGNMLLLASLTMGLVVFVIIIGLGFYIILSEQKQAQIQCDDIAIDLAKSLNAQNRIGQMNDTIEHTRELIYISRANLNMANDSMPAYANLADLLLTESVAASSMVEKERRNQIDLAVNNCRETVKKLRHTRTEAGNWLMPWFIENQLYINNVQLVTSNNLSNITSPAIIKDLYKFDLEKHYIEKNSKLYCGNINARLPPPDLKLDFYFSTLPACIENTISPVRLANQDDFVTSALIFDDKDEKKFNKPEQLPEGVRVLGNMIIHTDNKKGRFNIAASSTATAPGSTSKLP